jgi:Icc-related predicted phosphoesterase
VRRRRSRGTRVFFATDLHGSDLCFKKFCAAPDFYGATHLILGGDLTGKLLVPVVRNGRQATFHLGGVTEEVSLDDLDGQLKRLGNMGYYPVVGDAEMAEELADGERYEERLTQEALVRAERWVQYAEEKLAGRVQILVAGGNDDDPAVDEVFRDRGGVFVNGEGRVAEIGGLQVASCGWANPTPWNTPRECGEDELRERLATVVSGLDDPSGALFNFHVPPHETALDVCPELDDELRVVTVMGSPVQQHAGSTAVRGVIEELQPLVSLHGHIHESRGVEQIGRTTAVNAGSEYSEGVLLGAVVDLDGERASVVLTAG